MSLPVDTPKLVDSELDGGFCCPTFGLDALTWLVAVVGLWTAVWYTGPEYAGLWPWKRYLNTVCQPGDATELVAGELDCGFCCSTVCRDALAWLVAVGCERLSDTPAPSTRAPGRGCAAQKE